MLYKKNIKHIITNFYWKMNMLLCNNDSHLTVAVNKTKEVI